MSLEIKRTKKSISVNKEDKKKDFKNKKEDNAISSDKALKKITRTKREEKKELFVQKTDRKKAVKDSMEKRERTSATVEKKKVTKDQKVDTKKMRQSYPCPVYRKCGSCKYMDMDYEKQLKVKQKLVEGLLNKYCKIEEIEGMDNPYHYRNKVHAIFGRGPKGNIVSGVYEEKSHFIVPIESCLIEDEKADRIIGTIRMLLKSFKIKTYDEDTGYGLFRYVLVRKGFQTGQIMVVLVIADPILPSKNNFVKALRKEHPEISTIVLNINSRTDSMILGDREQVLYGKGYIEDRLCDLTFRISSRSFYQVNPVQTEKLYQKAIELARLCGQEIVLDAYCGIGTIGLIAAKSAKEVLGVEINKDAIKDAVANAKGNRIQNIRFFGADAGDFMRSIAKEGKTIDVVIMDPPRSGSTEVFFDSLEQLSPKRLVYISCNPETLARDLEYLKKKGYIAKEAWPFDLFPWTGHVETCVLLSHKKADSYINVNVDFGEGEGKIPMDKIAERADKFKPKDKVTYKMIKEYILDKYGFKVHTAYIAEVKRSLGLPMYDAPNAVEELKQPRKHPTEVQVNAIKDALEHFEVIK